MNRQRMSTSFKKSTQVKNYMTSKNEILLNIK